MEAILGILAILAVIGLITHFLGLGARKVRAKLSGRTDEEQKEREDEKVCRNCIHYNIGYCQRLTKNMDYNNMVNGDTNYCDHYEKNKRFIY